MHFIIVLNGLPTAAVIQLSIKSLWSFSSASIAVLLEEGFGEGCFEYRVCHCEDKARFVALCDLEVPRFLGDANLVPIVLSGPLFGSLDHS